MDCETARDQILESIANPEVDAHLGGCEACRTFAEAQFLLDRQLSAAITAPPLSATFRTSLKNRLRRETPKVWPQYLPELAQGVGCLAATAVCAVALPFATGQVILAGLAFTLVTCALQGALQELLQSEEP